MPGPELRALEPGDKLTGFSAGNAAFLPLKTFAAKQAHTLHAASLAFTYVVADDAQAHPILGYLTLTSSHISTDIKLVDGFPYKDYPAVKIARLFVDHRYRNRKLGRQLVEFALGIAKDDISSRIGCRFVVVDSKLESVDFYKALGFTFLDTDHNRTSKTPLLFVDLLKIAT